MKTATDNISISPVNMADRQKVELSAGDTVRVWQKVEEKGKIRLQPFEGIVLARKHGNEAGGTFTVRRVSGGYGVEKIFPLYSPVIDKIEVLRRAKMRRSKLYHIREKAAREIRRQMRNMMFVDIATQSDTEEKARLEAEAKAAEEAAAKAEEEAKKAEEEKVAKQAAAETKDTPADVEDPADESADADSEKEKPAEE